MPSMVETPFLLPAVDGWMDIGMDRVCVCVCILRCVSVLRVLCAVDE